MPPVFLPENLDRVAWKATVHKFAKFKATDATVGISMALNICNREKDYQLEERQKSSKILTYALLIQ